MIRAGYLIDNQGYQSGTPDTYMSGWGYEYLQDISYHTEGWKYEYVLGTFSELIAKHEAGEIDLMSSISYTPERAENLLYSTNPSGKKCYYVYVKPARGDLTVGDPEALRGKTIGVNPDVLQTTEGKAWLAERGIDVTYKEYATGGEVFSALSSGEVDAIIMNDVLSSDDAMPVFYVGESDYYFTVPKSRPDIMAELDAAMAQILTSNLHYNDEFKARYSAINVGSSSLTDRERDRLASCDNTVTVGYLDLYGSGEIVFDPTKLEPAKYMDYIFTRSGDAYYLTAITESEMKAESQTGSVSSGGAQAPVAPQDQVMDNVASALPESVAPAQSGSASESATTDPASAPAE